MSVESQVKANPPDEWTISTPANGKLMYEGAIKKLQDNIETVAKAVDDLPQPPTQHYIPKVFTMHSHDTEEAYHVLSSEDKQHGWFDLTKDIVQNGVSPGQHVTQSVDYGICMHQITVSVSSPEYATEPLSEPTDIAVSVYLSSDSDDVPRNTQWGLAAESFFPIRLLKVSGAGGSELGYVWYGTATQFGACHGEGMNQEIKVDKIRFVVNLNNGYKFTNEGIIFKLSYKCAFMNEARNIS